MKNSLNHFRFIMVCFFFHLISFQVFPQKSEVIPESTENVNVDRFSADVKMQKSKSISERTLPKETFLKSSTSGYLDYIWGKHLSTSYDDRYYAVVMDAEGNVITVGTQGESSSDVDGVIYKNDNSGTFLWSDAPLVSSDIDGMYDVTVDNYQNIYITGKYCNYAFNSRLSSHGNADIFVAKYSTPRF